ncbi:MAG: sel1 repeat family protein, partial [Tenericutes bacterium]|nr:sel1 repeat family protein [Mycoplasmatota bacterium]
KMYLLCEKDENINNDFLNKINLLIKNNNLYECMIECLYYSIVENKQPRYITKVKVEINDKEMKDYLTIKLYEGISYITSLKELAKKGNMYANAELGSLEFSGLITGSVDYETCYSYYYKSALKNHPKGCWMIANLIFTKRVNKDFDLAWKYLNKAIDLGSIAALNTMGNCYLNGITPNNKKDLNKAIKYYLEASEYGYVYAFNNLGKIYEKTNPDKSINYYKLSADLKESWALNKVAEYYRKSKDLKTAFIYYEEAINCPLREKNYYAYYNLAKYYYFDSDINKAIEYLTIAANNGIKEAKELLKILL